MSEKTAILQYWEKRCIWKPGKSAGEKEIEARKHGKTAEKMFHVKQMARRGRKYMYSKQERSRKRDAKRTKALMGESIIENESYT